MSCDKCKSSLITDSSKRQGRCQACRNKTWSELMYIEWRTDMQEIQNRIDVLDERKKEKYRYK
jgi:hypothetical protein